jgi:hypothetical protein
MVVIQKKMNTGTEISVGKDQISYEEGDRGVALNVVECGVRRFANNAWGRGRKTC